MGANDDARTEEVLLFLNLNSLTTSTSTHCTVHATFTTLTLSVTINLSTHFTILFDPFLSLPSRFHFHHLHFGRARGVCVTVMYCGEEEKQWTCGKAGAANLRKVSSIVRDIGDPCLSQSPVKVVVTVNRMLKSDKWQTMSDSEGKVFGFRKALKLIVLGGVDPSIRPEVWEFLLGCYSLSSTAEYRRRLRAARREHYSDLIKQCQTMHSSVGTGSLAYVVGSKVMDMRTSSKDGRKSQAKIEGSTYDNNVEVGKCYDRSIICTEVENSSHWESSNNGVDLVSLRVSADNAACDSSGKKNSSSPKSGGEEEESDRVTECSFDFPPLSVTNLFEKSGKDKNSGTEHGDKLPAPEQSRFEVDSMHSFQINNNVELVIESNCQQPLATLNPMDSEIGIASPDEEEPELLSENQVYEAQMVNQLKISDVPQPAMIRSPISQGWPVNEERVSEWLWTLHRIVVDVVRTDSHLEFYEDKRNLARMSDILAVYAWRENFQMEGPTRVMNQLRALWHILELLDKEMFAHLSKIGAESLHFAFRMLLVLFRRELSFNEALSMWEMMWAADFDESMAYDLEENCLEALELQLPRDSSNDMREEIADSDGGSVKSGSRSNHNENDNTKASPQSNHERADHSVYDSKLKSLSSHTFCGLARNIWPRNHQVQMSSISLTRKGNNELAIFCVAAILMFNDKVLKINVKSCITKAIKLRKKYFNKLKVVLLSEVHPAAVCPLSSLLFFTSEKIDKGIFHHSGCSQSWIPGTGYANNSLSLNFWFSSFLEKVVQNLFLPRGFGVRKKHTHTRKKGFIVSSWMANPSGNHQEHTHVVSSSAPETSGAALAMKHNPGISLDWTAEEQAILEDGLSKYASESNIVRYAKIALQLQHKTVRDVALRVRWMNKKENSKRRKDDHNLTRKSKDKKERVSDPAVKSSNFTARSNVSPYAPPMITMDNDDGISYTAIGGPTGDLLEQNAQALNQISTNLSAFQVQENINLFCQTRDNILKIMNELNDSPEVMKQMPPLPVKVNEELASSILPRTNLPPQS
ncbi:GTPase-activating protein GYP7 [Glycine soja]